MMYCRVGTIISLAALLFGGASLVFAQNISNYDEIINNFELPENIIDIPLSVEMRPEFPEPYQEVTIEVRSFSSDLDRASITWSVNGNIQKKGVGERIFKVKTAGLGTSQTIKITAINEFGVTGTETIHLAPAEVDLLWSASPSSVPPFYKGKALIPLGGTVSFLAVPHFVTAAGASVSAKSISYRWKIDNKTNPDISGFGKDNALISLPPFSKPTTIEVTASTVDGKISAARKISLQGVLPIVLLYEDDPLWGIRFEKALAGLVALRGSEMRLVAMPFYLSSRNFGRDGLYRWIMNGTVVQGETSSSITLRREPTMTGQTSVGVTVTSPTKKLQTGQASLSLDLGSETTDVGGSGNNRFRN